MCIETITVFSSPECGCSYINVTPCPFAKHSTQINIPPNISFDSEYLPFGRWMDIGRRKNSGCGGDEGAVRYECIEGKCPTYPGSCEERYVREGKRNETCC
jgi:hypothetical protein